MTACSIQAGSAPSRTSLSSMAKRTITQPYHARTAHTAAVNRSTMTPVNGLAARREKAGQHVDRDMAVFARSSDTGHHGDPEHHETNGLVAPDEAARARPAQQYLRRAETDHAAQEHAQENVLENATKRVRPVQHRPRGRHAATCPTRQYWRYDSRRAAQATGCTNPC